MGDAADVDLWRPALAAVIAFLGLNGHRLTLTNDQAYTLVMDIASGRLDDVADIAERIRQPIAPRRRRHESLRRLTGAAWGRSMRHRAYP